MSDVSDLLVEVGTEELPPKSLKRLSQAFGELLRGGLEKASLNHGEIRRYATPRRLAVLVENVAKNQPEQHRERRGPALAAAFDEADRPTQAALGFARSCGVEVDELERLETEKGRWLVFRSTNPGQAATSLLPGIVGNALAKLPISKRMRWADLDVEFVRPVHWVVMLLGKSTVAADILGVTSGHQSRGHRFHHPDALTIREPADYVSQLFDSGYVVASFSTRLEMIRKQVEDITEGLGGDAVIDEDLLEEVTGLVEWPVPVLGNFDKRFLDLPSRVLIATMQDHQKYFHVVDKENRLLPHFVAISNIHSANPVAVKEGNERVIRPRLEDAAFFYETDLQESLENRLDDLKGVVFQEQLGTLNDKSRRVSTLSAHVSIATGAMPEEVNLARRAGLLSKCDLVTSLVGEFPELQGYMGREYARKNGEPEAVATALEELYMPRFAGDRIPESACGRAVAIADKLDTLVGIFGIGQVPSGEKDPFGLRRAALGVLRILIEAKLDLELPKLLEAAQQGYGNRLDDKRVVEHVFDFMMDRLRAYFLDKDVPGDVFSAVLARRPTRPHDLSQRVLAVDTFRKLPEAASLTAANKRIQNILKQANEPVPDEVNDALFAEDAEWDLAAKLTGLRPSITALLQKGDYTSALTQLAGLRDSVDAFFDGVRVMADDEATRRNRLALLHDIRELFLHTADVSRLQI